MTTDSIMYSVETTIKDNKKDEFIELIKKW